jgi:anti-sigma regulatory factor (Ser/Thr protein kinase)
MRDRPAGARAATGSGPSSRALGGVVRWYAIALRLGGAFIFAVVGPLSATAAISAAWLSPVLAALSIWSTAFAWLVWRRGLTWWAALADAGVIAALVATQVHVVPGAMTGDGTTWMLPLASTSVFILQLALRPVFSLPAAGVITTVYVESVRHPADAWILVLQAVVTTALMTLLRDGGRSADAVIVAALQGDQDRRAESARRADEREQHRQLHDTILSTVTMIASGAFTGRSVMLCEQANRDFDVLQRMRATPGDVRGGKADLCARIGEVAAQAAPLYVRLMTSQVSVPPAVTEHMAGSVAEALRNVARHADAAEAEITIGGGDGWAMVEVTDRGVGFDPGSVPESRRGVRESIAGRMSDIGGTAEVRSRAGAGTTITLRWPA